MTSGLPRCDDGVVVVVDVLPDFSVSVSGVRIPIKKINPCGGFPLLVG